MSTFLLFCFAGLLDDIAIVLLLNLLNAGILHVAEWVYTVFLLLTLHLNKRYFLHRHRISEEDLRGLAVDLFSGQ